MIRSTIRLLLVLGLLIASTTGPTAAEETAAAPFEEALSWLAADTANLAFNDWDAMKAAHGFEALTSSIPQDLRIERMIDLTRREAPFAGFGLGHLPGHAETWGWDSTDLAWEAQLFGPSAPLSVLRFRDGFDLGPFVARLDERGFETRAAGGAVIRSHPFDITAEWARTTDLAIFNLALLDDGRTVVASNSPDELDAALARRGSDAASPMPSAATASVGPVHSAIVELGIDTCAAYDPRAFGDVPTETAELIEAVLPLGAWTSLTVTTSRDGGGDPRGRLTMTFPGTDPNDLAAEVAGRARLGREGTSARTGGPFAEDVFRVLAADAADGRVTLDLEPVERLGRLRDVVLSRDLLPAMC